jgi:hypothetical protein
MFEVALREELVSIISQIYPLQAPEGTVAPYLIYTSSEGIYDKTLEGFLNSKEVSVELDIINISYSSMKALSKLIIDKLKTFEQRVIGTSGPYIQELTFSDDSPELYESEVNLYRKIISFKINFKEE